LAARRARNSDASGYGGSVEAAGTAPVEGIIAAGLRRRDTRRRGKGYAGFEGDGGNAKKAAAISAVILAVFVRMLVRSGAAVIRCGNSGVVMYRPITMRMCGGVCLCLMHMRGGTCVGQAMSVSIPERQGRMGHEHTKGVEDRKPEGGPKTKCLGQACQHRAMIKRR